MYDEAGDDDQQAAGLPTRGRVGDERRLTIDEAEQMVQQYDHEQQHQPLTLDYFNREVTSSGALQLYGHEFELNFDQNIPHSDGSYGGILQQNEKGSDDQNQVLPGTHLAKPKKTKAASTGSNELPAASGRKCRRAQHGIQKSPRKKRFLKKTTTKSMSRRNQIVSSLVIRNVETVGAQEQAP